MSYIKTAGIRSEDVINFLKKDLALQEIILKIASERVIKEVADEKGITISIEEIQVEGDRWREQNNLQNTSDLITWLVEKELFYQDWEQKIRDRLLAQKLAKHLFDRQVEEYFTEHQAEFEQILLYQIVVPFERIARDLFYQIEEQEFSFFEAAHLYDIDQRRRLTCGYQGWLTLSELQPEFIEAILNAKLGELIRPIKTEAGYHLLLVEQVIEARLTPKTRGKIVNKFFEEWLKCEVNYRMQKHRMQEVSNQTIESFSSPVKMNKK